MYVKIIFGVIAGAKLPILGDGHIFLRTTPLQTILPLKCQVSTKNYLRAPEWGGAPRRF